MAEIACHQSVIPFQGNRGDQRIGEPKAMGETVVVQEGDGPLQGDG